MTHRTDPQGRPDERPRYLHRGVVALLGAVLGAFIMPFPGCHAPSPPPHDMPDSEASATASQAQQLDPDKIFAPGRVLSVSIELDSAAWELLRHEHPPEGWGPFGAQCHPFNHDFRYSYYPAAVEVDGLHFERVGVRKRSYCGSEQRQKPGLMIRFDKYEGSLSLAPGISRMLLSNAAQDRSYLRQCLGMLTFERAGLPAPRCNFARVRVNGGEPALYVHVEPIRSPFLARSFDDPTGNLYEGTLSDFHPDWQENFELKTRPNVDAHHDIQRATQAIHNTDRPVLQRVSERFNLTTASSFWATEVVLAAWDGYNSNQNNFYIYADPVEKILRFIPWGLDHVMSNASASAIGVESWLSRILYLDPEGQDLYYAALDRVLDQTWDEALLVTELDRLSDAITPFLSDAEYDRTIKAIASTREFILVRRMRLIEQLADGPLISDQGPPAVPTARQIGELKVSFEATWGTLGSDALVTGAADLTGSLSPFELDVVRKGAVLGRSGTATQLLVATELASGDLLNLRIVGTPEDFRTGEDIEINFTAWVYGGVFHKSPNDTQHRLIGRFTDGELSLKKFGTADGSKAEGTFSVRVIEINP
ncbi:MAG: CotH kinase family protein [Nannocystaceae bacterium]